MTVSLIKHKNEPSVKIFRPYRGITDAELMARLVVQDLAENGGQTPFDIILKGILKKATSRNSLIMENSGYIRIFNDHQFGFLRFDLEKNKRNEKNIGALKEKLKDICIRSNKKLRVMLMNSKGWKHGLVKELGFSPIRYFFEMERTKLEKQWYKINFDSEGLILEPFSSKMNLKDFNDCFNKVYADSFEHTPVSIKEWKNDITEGVISSDTFFALKDTLSRIVGFLILSNYLHDKQGHKYGFIEEIGVTDRYRGRGIGTRLLKYGVGRLQSTYQQKYVRLHVDGENRYKALNIYKNNGFVIKSMSTEYQYSL